MSNLLQTYEADWYEASARERVAGLLDANSFVEFLGPEQRAMSPHLAQFDLTGAFDDGIVVGRGRLDGQEVFVAAQEGRFLGGAFGEVHGAKLVGLVRSAGTPVLALVGGRAGAFGGGGIVTACCSRIVASEHARVSVSGPEVIETNKGVEEFDSKDRALVWRVCGARTRYLTGGVDRYVKGSIQDFRETAIALIAHAPLFELATLKAEQRRLSERLQRFGDCRDAPEIWRKAGLSEPEHIDEITDDAFLAVQRIKESDHGAR